MKTARTWVRGTPTNVSSFEAWEEYVRAIQVDAARAQREEDKRACCDDCSDRLSKSKLVTDEVKP